MLETSRHTTTLTTACTNRPQCMAGSGSHYHVWSWSLGQCPTTHQDPAPDCWKPNGVCWSRYMADQVIGFLQDIAAAVMAVWHRRELPHREVEGEIIRPPMFEGNWGNKPERCLVDEAFKGLVADPVVRPGYRCKHDVVCWTVAMAQ